MSERLNKTSICSIVFLDIIEYTQKPVSEQIACKDLFNRLINDAIKDVAQNDRILVDSGDGAAISLLGAPEEALFIALTIRDEILSSNRLQAEAPLKVRIGINLGPVRVVKDINDQLNIIGDGINVAQRVMSFAEVNQILVSRSYYEIVSRLSSEISQMFAYSGIKHDKHVREHEVYVIRSPEPAAIGGAGVAEAEALAPIRKPNKPVSKAFIGAGLALAALAMGTVILMDKTKPAAGATQTALSSPAEPVQSSTESGRTEQPHKRKQAYKREWSSLTQSFKQGKESPVCSDAQRSLKQCG